MLEDIEIRDIRGEHQSSDRMRLKKNQRVVHPSLIRGDAPRAGSNASNYAGLTPDRGSWAHESMCRNIADHGLQLLLRHALMFVCRNLRSKSKGEFGHCHRRMIKRSCLKQHIHCNRGVAAQHVKIDAGIQQQRCADRFLVAGKREVAVRATS